jgi:hypothetical protein
VPKAEDAEGSPGARIEAFRQARGLLRFDPEARNAKHFRVKEDERTRTWRIEQTLVDPEDQNDWFVTFTVDLDASDAAGAPVLRWLSLSEG